ncbi:ribosome small subunit-dependent GTPase A [Desulfocurvus vexinensis]|uniref:ribosome small subunit-dependent GTPase A n=1 Tax=Desulfocurvus vexinensis TaxID=399548 RepID=UPI0004B91D58|nr:ribosome small subunit-dependent GTPase A [Desulfocurvus vexinensis]
MELRVDVTPLRALGFDAWFEARAGELGLEGCGFARVVAVDRGAWLIRDGSGEIPAELSGRLAFQTEGPADLPCVGDWVTVSLYNDGAAALIHRVFPRRTLLRRKAPGGAGVQLIAANIDAAFIVQSCHFDFNPARLDRYLVMAAQGQVEPVVVLTKTDLIDPQELEHKCALAGAATRARVIALSAHTGAGFADFQQALAPGRTYCLLGSSGVGKTTLLNRLLGRETFGTSAVSATGEGTHTTTRRQLVMLGQGAMLVDTPGMRELGMAGAGEGVATGFDEVAALAEHCRYADCRHENEPGCAVRAALASGALRADRYASYLKLRKEAEFQELSALDKRRRDKAFGRLVKEVKERGPRRRG